MKDHAIKKINGIGKAGNIIANICKLLLIIGTVLGIVITTVSFVLPRGSVVFKEESKAELSLDAAAVGRSLSEEDRRRIEDNQSTWGVSVDGEPFTSVDVSGNVIRYKTEMEISKRDFRDLAPRFALIAVFICLMTITMFFASDFFKALRHCASPFEENVLIKMKHLAFSLIPWGLVEFSSFNVADFVFGDTRVGIGLNAPMVLVVLVVIAMMYIFRYGAALQQESDETL